MSDTLLTDASELQRRLDAARERRRRAVAAESRVRRAVVEIDRRLVAQRKIVLGAALLRLAEGDGSRHLPTLRALLLPFVTRETDRVALVGTVFDPAGDPS